MHLMSFNMSISFTGRVKQEYKSPIQDESPNSGNFAV